MIDSATGSGILMTVDPGRVELIAGQSGTDFGILLGRAIAHETGHLLLGTSRHTPSGLMRAVWSQKEIRANRGEDWELSDSDAAVVRRRMAGLAAAN
jgi:hypothetical protein